jgi:hypothetical protein
VSGPAMRLTQADLTPCPECGAAYYGNASCLRCHRQWAKLWGHECDLCRQWTVVKLDGGEPLIDPDCRTGKHTSCTGGPCQCPCHHDEESAT